MPDNADLLIRRPEGLYCPAGDFYIDPWRPVARAVITHAHADHARSGHGAYLAQRDAEGVMRSRLGEGIAFQGLAYGESIQLGNARVSLHPAGHVLGSAQVRVEVAGEVWVVSGDYFVSGAGDAHPSCPAFEPQRCHCFITESTFALPIFRWAPQAELMAEIRQWWADCAAQGQQALLLGYSFGKAQRLLAGLGGEGAPGPVFAHAAVQRLNQAYREAGVPLPPAADVGDTALPPGSLVLAPPGVEDSAWARRLGARSTAFASGWMRLRGARRRRGVDRGFVVSDHADWPGLLSAIAATGAPRVLVTHGYEQVLIRHLREQGLDASAISTEYGATDDDAGNEA